MKNLFLQTLQGAILPQKPVWFMRQAGRYLPEYRAIRARHRNFLDMCFSAETACEITLQPITRFSFDAAIIFSDILVIPYGLGQHVSFVAGKGPVLSPIRQPSEIAALKPSRQHEILQPLYDAVRLTRRALPTNTALIGFAGSPWTLATYMLEGGSSRDFARTKLFAYREPVAFRQLLSILTQSVSEHLLQQVDAGADAVQLFDSWAGAVPQDLFSAMVLEPTATIVATLRQRLPQLPIIGFAKGASQQYAAYAQTGIRCLGIDSTTPLPWVFQQVPHAVTQGNLDPMLLVAGGDALDSAVDTLLEQTRHRPHIINLGHGIVPQTPIAHVERLLEKIRNGGR